MIFNLAWAWFSTR